MFNICLTLFTTWQNISERRDKMADTIITIAQIQFKRGTAQRMIEVNPLLAEGEPGYEYDTHKLKIGDGIHKWNDLPYIGNNNSEISGTEEIISVNLFNELPKKGESSKLYRVISNKLLYQWNSQSNSYEALGGEGSFDPSTITLINGGNANG